MNSVFYMFQTSVSLKRAILLSEKKKQQQKTRQLKHTIKYLQLNI